MINSSPTGPIRETINGTARHSGEPDDEFDVSILFAYTSETPYSIHVDITTGDQRKPWEFARDVLADALATQRSVGIGDVEAALISPDVLLLRLWDPGYGRLGVHFDMYLPRHHVRRFVAATCRMVPFGSEGDYLDIDNVLGRLFA